MDKTIKRVSMFVILSLLIFTTWFIYMNEPIGDDVLCYFDGAFTRYLDEIDYNLGNKIKNFPQICTLLKFIYMNWSGRMTGYTVNLFGKLAPKIVLAMITSVIFVTNIVLSIKIAYGTFGKAMEMPTSYLVVFLALYWMKPQVYYSYMWTMTSIYGMSLMLVLMYYILAVQNIHKNNFITPMRVIVIQFIGIITGLSHEVISLCLIFMIIANFIRDVFINKKKWTEIFIHTGLGIGYLISFFAPGNFNRTAQSHDTVFGGYISRIGQRILVNVYVFAGSIELKILSGTMFILALVAFIKLYRQQKGSILAKELLNSIDIIVGIMSLILIYPILPKTPIYGLDLLIVLVYIIMLRVLSLADLKISSRNIQWKMTIGIIVLFFIIYGNELVSFTRTSLIRSNLLAQAKQQSQSEVRIPAYDEWLSANRYNLDYLNGQGAFDSSYYLKYYEIHIIIE